MKKHIYLILLILILLSWCSENNYSDDNYEESYKYEEECIEPENPYQDWWGHDAGRNWAEETWWDCETESESFNEWCEEYYSALDSYNECESIWK